jgi:ribosomal protein L37AE/L43A
MTNQELRWVHNLSSSLIEKVTLTVDQYFYRCECCNRLIGITKPQDSWRCPKCNSTTFYHSYEPINNTQDSDVINFFKEFAIDMQEQKKD